MSELRCSWLSASQVIIPRLPENPWLPLHQVVYLENSYSCINDVHAVGGSGFAGGAKDSNSSLVVDLKLNDLPRSAGGFDLNLPPRELA
ncbi:hypothetical protein C1H46_029151 [Malus baccata]|uniref:Uncharacterized protein n=1 Tax=Malus baccata TaxID=106549 RepID=A0A540LFQ8_MALBA|nr:hypothetical protein C1H46_029151 [Malus baccata]